LGADFDHLPAMPTRAMAVEATPLVLTRMSPESVPSASAWVAATAGRGAASEAVAIVPTRGCTGRRSAETTHGRRSQRRVFIVISARFNSQLSDQKAPSQVMTNRFMKFRIA
jgi:hypothetical protein